MDFEKTKHKLDALKIQIEACVGHGNYARYPELTRSHDELSGALMKELREQAQNGINGTRDHILEIVRQSEKHMELMNGPVENFRTRNVPGRTL